MRVAGILLCLFAHLLLPTTCAPAQENSAEPVCPAECVCGRIDVRCKGVGLEEIVHFLTPSVKTVALTDCRMTTLPMKLLENATNLELLRITNCGVERISLPPGESYESYVGFRRLRSINVSDNELSDFAEAMEIMGRIGPYAGSIDLSGNDIVVVNFTDDGRYSSVRTLNLSRNAIDTLLALPRSLQVRRLLR